MPDLADRATAAPGRDDDLVQPFQIEAHAIRGRLVRLGPLLDGVLSHHSYPEPVAALLGQMLALATALANAFKYDGVFSLQAKGSGPVSMLVTDVTSQGEVRGYARFDTAALERAERERAAGQGAQGVVPRLLGSGCLAFTVDQGAHTERYQGIVELQGAELVDCIHHYFRQSEQLEAAFKLAIGQVEDGARGRSWRAAALMIQRLPLVGGEGGAAAEDKLRESQEDAWRRAVIMMSSATTAELLDPALGAQPLLFRLFHEDGVRVFRRRPLRPGCRCSEARVVTVLRALSPEELADMTIDGRVLVVCQFCKREYAFDEAAIRELRAS